MANKKNCVERRRASERTNELSFLSDGIEFSIVSFFDGIKKGR